MLASKTKESYRSQLKKFSKWLKKKEYYSCLIPTVAGADEPAHFALLRAEGVFLDPQSLDIEWLKQYAAELVNRKDENGNPKPVGISALNGLRSAVVWTFSATAVMKPATFDSQLHGFFKGLKRTDAMIRRESNGGVNVRPGKDSLPFAVYAALCREMLLAKEANLRWAHCYATLSWNLMSRTNNVEDLRLSRVSWKDDALLVYFAQLKNDQSGLRLRDPTHLFANPLRPEICPVLALGILLASGACTVDGGLLFPGGRQSQRFSDNLNLALKRPDVERALNAVGRNASEICTHSFRKGSASYAASGSVGGPSFAAIHLRARWLMGAVHERYIRYEHAGDQYCGRVVTGLPLQSSDFAVLPPHFPPECAAADQAARSVFGARMWGETHLRGVLRHCLASMVHHSEWLLEHMHAESALRLSAPWNSAQMLNNLRPFVISGRSSPHLTATGIPPHVELIMRSERQEAAANRVAQAVGDFPQEVGSQLSELMRQRDAESGNVLPTVFADMIRNLEQRVAAGQQALAGQIAQMANGGGVGMVSGAAHGDSGGNESGVFHWRSTDGEQEARPRLLPENWKLPSINLSTGWNLWWRGEPDKGIKPYREIVSHIDVPSASRERFRFWMSIFKRLETILRRLGSFVEEPSDEQVEKMLPLALEVVIKWDQSRTSGRKRGRYNEIRVDTYVKKMKGLTGTELLEFVEKCQQPEQ